MSKKVNIKALDKITDAVVSDKPDNLRADNLPAATHTANFLKHFGVNVDYYILEDGRRLISKTGMATAIGQSPTGGAFERAVNRQKYIGAKLREKVDNPVLFQSVKGGAKVIHGYDATILIDFCKAVVKAGDKNELKKSQQPMLRQAHIILGASAKLGITKLGDLLANYDGNRAEYLELWKAFVRQEARSYEKEFSDEFYDLFYKLYGVNKDDYRNNHPRFFAKLTRKYIYTPLANSNGAILDHLDKSNPVIYKGNRKFKLHQFLNEIGVKALQQHLGQIIAIGKLSKNLAGFKKNFDDVFNPQTSLPFDDLDDD